MNWKPLKHIAGVKNLFKNNIFIVGDEYSRGIGKKLFNNGVRHLHVVTKPNAKFASMSKEIENTLNMASRGSTLVLILGSSRHIFEDRGYISKIMNIIKTTAKMGIRLLISSMRYSKNVHRNKIIYEENCILYDSLCKWQHIDILELNITNQNLHEAVEFKLRYPMQRIGNVISLTHEEQCDVAYSSKNVTNETIKSKNTRNTFLERERGRRNLVRIKILPN
jgi:hypothetical protein